MKKKKRAYKNKHACTQTNVRIDMNALRNTQIRARVHPDKRTHIHARTLKHADTNTHAHKHMHEYTCTHSEILLKELLFIFPRRSKAKKTSLGEYTAPNPFYIYKTYLNTLNTFKHRIFTFPFKCLRNKLNRINLLTSLK